MLETRAYGFEKLRAEQVELGRKVRALLESQRPARASPPKASRRRAWWSATPTTPASSQRQEVPRRGPADRRRRAAAVRRSAPTSGPSASACSAWTSCTTSTAPSPIWKRRSSASSPAIPHPARQPEAHGPATRWVSLTSRSDVAGSSARTGNVPHVRAQARPRRRVDPAGLAGGAPLRPWRLGHARRHADDRRSDRGLRAARAGAKPTHARSPSPRSSACRPWCCTW